MAKCSDNNRASTVYTSFLQAVGQYGLPSRIRVDQGGENVQVAQHMLRHRGLNRRSVLVGSSVPQPAYRKADSHRCATAFYYRLFHFLEENDLLNQEHLYALHYVYLRINRALQVFRSSWNEHGLRTERGQTPNQLFTTGVLRMSFFERDYGTVEEGSGSVANTLQSGVPVPRISVTPSDNQMINLRSSVDPLATSEDYGIMASLYTLLYTLQQLE